MSKKKIMVIYGGISAEREISIISSKEIIKSLRSLNYEVIDIDADPSLLKQINYYKPNVIFNNKLCLICSFSVIHFVRCYLI